MEIFFSLFFLSSATAPILGWGGMPVETAIEPRYFLGLKSQKGVVVGVRDDLFAPKSPGFLSRELKGKSLTGDSGRDFEMSRFD